MQYKTLEEKVANYSKTFPNYPKLVVDKGWLYGVWVLGRNYKSKRKYYGEYPPGYLKRIYPLFDDAKEVLHLFGGVVEKGKWQNEITFDINPDLKPDVVGDAHKLSTYFKKDKFDLILADPPYSAEDAKMYNTPMVRRFTIVKECYKILKPGGYLCWLDQILPMYKRELFKFVGTIGMVRSVNHRIRLVAIFQKVDKDNDKPVIHKLVPELRKLKEFVDW